MKFTIYGFSQKRLIELDLDHTDALILRYFIDFKDSGKMTTELFDNEVYYWITYEKAIKEIPIIGITNNNNMYRRFKKLVKANVLKHRTKRKGGTFSFFKTDKEYYSLISEGYVSKDGEGTSQKTEGSAPKDGTNNPSTKDIDKYIVQSSKLWEMYPLKKGKAQVIKKIPQIIKKYSFEELERAIKRYIEYVESKRKTKFELSYQNGSTFFNGGYVDYLDENYQEEMQSQGSVIKEPKRPSRMSVDEALS